MGRGRGLIRHRAVIDFTARLRRGLREAPSEQRQPSRPASTTILCPRSRSALLATRARGSTKPCGEGDHHRRDLCHSGSDLPSTLIFPPTPLSHAGARISVDGLQSVSGARRGYGKRQWAGSRDARGDEGSNVRSACSRQPAVTGARATGTAGFSPVWPA